MSARVVIVVGHQGQDGRLLTNLLLRRGDIVLGIGRQGTEAFGPIQYMTGCSLASPRTVHDFVLRHQPHEVYYLAAYHASSQINPEEPLHEWESLHAVNVNGLLHFLEAVRAHAPACRLFYASSSLVYGSNPASSPQTELTPFTPDEPYGSTKAHAVDICRDYRRRHGVFASVGILYNHESALRSADFLSIKLARGALAARSGDRSHVVVGSLDASADWGYAPDFVDAFTRILALEHPDDFIVATGTLHTVREFAEVAYGQLGLLWSDFVHEKPSLLKRHRTGRLGDPAKLQQFTGWQPSLSFAGMVRALVNTLDGGGTHTALTRPSANSTAT